MNSLYPGELSVRVFERVVISIVQIFLMVVVAATALHLWYLLYQSVSTSRDMLTTVAGLQEVIEGTFGGVLLVMLGLEFMETLRVFTEEHHIRLEIVLIVAAIAVGRHVIKLDVAHASMGTLLGLSALMLALTVGYFLVRRAGSPTPGLKLSG